MSNPHAAPTGDLRPEEPVAFVVESVDGRRQIMLRERYDPRKPEFWVSPEAQAAHVVTALYPRDEALVSAQAAAVAGAAEITMGLGLNDVTEIRHEGRRGILFRPRPSGAVIPVGEEGELQPGPYWPAPNDIVIWIKNPEGAAVIFDYLAPFLAQPAAVAGDVWWKAVDKIVNGVAELPGRTPPADQPYMMLVTPGELRCIAGAAILALVAPKVEHPAAVAGDDRREKGWLRRAVENLLPLWGSFKGDVVKGVPDAYHCDPRFGIKQWESLGGDLAIGLMVGNDHSEGGRWVEQRFTPEQCVQIVASILSKPAMEPAAGPLLDAILALVAPQVDAALERAAEVADAEAGLNSHAAGLATAWMSARNIAAAIRALKSATPARTYTEAENAEPLAVVYRNWRGETSTRRIVPLAAPRFGTSEWHKEPQWLLRALDVDKGEEREFAMNDMAGATATEADTAAARAEERERCWREAQFVGSEFNMLWNDNVDAQLNLARREAAYRVRDRIKALPPAADADAAGREGGL